MAASYHAQRQFSFFSLFAWLFAYRFTSIECSNCVCVCVAMHLSRNYFLIFVTKTIWPRNLFHSELWGERVGCRYAMIVCVCACVVHDNSVDASRSTLRFVRMSITNFMRFSPLFFLIFYFLRDCVSAIPYPSSSPTTSWPNYIVDDDFVCSRWPYMSFAIHQIDKYHGMSVVDLWILSSWHTQTHPTHECVSAFDENEIGRVSRASIPFHFVLSMADPMNMSMFSSPPSSSSSPARVQHCAIRPKPNIARSIYNMLCVVRQ